MKAHNLNSSGKMIVPHLGLWLFVIYCIISLHFTDAKIAGIKLNEFVSLLAVPFLLYSIRHVNKYILYFIGLFVSFLLFTFLFNLSRDFYYDQLQGLSLLKKPYFITLSRFAELVACLAFALIVYKTFAYYIAKGLTANYILRRVLDANFYLSLVLLALFALTYVHILSLAGSTVVYDTTPYAAPTLRLKGFYVEGGPLGLFYSALYMLTFFVGGRKWVYRLTFLLVIFCAQSKAGIVGVLIWHFYLLYQRFRNASWFKYVILALLIPVFYIIFTKVIANYIEAIGSFKILVADRKDDYNYVMGRISAIFLTPNMVLANPVFGIGMGNYALVRNDPDYLGFLPAVTDWDAPGLGVFVTLLIESGLAGLLAFVLIIYSIYRRYAPISSISDKSIKVFVIICLLGVQLHFLYIWFFIGLALAAPDDEYQY